MCKGVISNLGFFKCFFLNEWTTHEELVMGKMWLKLLVSKVCDKQFGEFFVWCGWKSRMGSFNGGENVLYAWKGFLAYFWVSWDWMNLYYPNLKPQHLAQILKIQSKLIHFPDHSFEDHHGRPNNKYNKLMTVLSNKLRNYHRYYYYYKKFIDRNL